MNTNRKYIMIQLSEDSGFLILVCCFITASASSGLGTFAWLEGIVLEIGTITSGVDPWSRCWNVKVLLFHKEVVKTTSKFTDDPPQGFISKFGFDFVIIQMKLII